MVTTLQVYMAAYSCELSILAALLVGAGIGAFIAYGYGRDRGYDAGRDDGVDWGLWAARPRRNAKGQFTK